jgi:hypothetical protein
MKVTKPFCVDDELIRELTKVNASELVNSLLKEHFDDKNSMSLKKLKHKLSENLQKKKVLLRDIRDLRGKIAEIEAKEAKILKISKKYPDYVFKTIEGCTNVMAFYSAFRNDDKLRKYGWLELKKLFNHLKGGAAT